MPSEIARTRGNIYVRQPNGGVFLYTNTRGHRLPFILQSALVRGRGKWGNTGALTRVIFSQMIESDVLSTEGFGISTQIADNDYLILVVDDQKEIVGVCGESGHCYKTYTFEKFCTLTEDKLPWRVLSGGVLFEDDTNNSAQNHDYKFQI